MEERREGEKSGEEEGYGTEGEGDQTVKGSVVLPYCKTFYNLTCTGRLDAINVLGRLTTTARCRF